MVSFRDILKFTAGVATGWIAHIFATRADAKNRVRNAKEEFLAVVAAQRASLDGLSGQDYMHFNRDQDVLLKDSVEAMTLAVFRAQPYLTIKERACVATVLTEYQAYKEQYTGRTRRELDETSLISYVQRLQAYMQRFDECIHK